MLEHPPLAERSPGARLHLIREKLMALDAAAAVEFLQLTSFDRLLKSTISLCPECDAHVPALVFSRQGRVLVRKNCEQHGFSEA